MNDTVSHAAGDKCLAKVVEIIGTVIAGKGKLYRYGGDEFTVLLKNFSAHEAAATADRIRSDIDKGNPGESVKVTASIGVVCSSQPGAVTAEQLLDIADKAMYKAKQEGKNRVSIWEPE